MNIKEKIKDRINSINDPQLLDELLRAVELEYAVELCKSEINAIDIGVSDAEAGKLFSNAEASQLVKKWVKK